jgi:hypothetical protein
MRKITQLYIIKRAFLNLTPCAPLSLKGEGEEKKEGH